MNWFAFFLILWYASVVGFFICSMLAASNGRDRLSVVLIVAGTIWAALGVGLATGR